MRIIVASLVLALNASMCLADEDADILNVLSAAYDQHKSNWTSGRVAFKESLFFDAKDKRFMEMEGEVEWKTDYFHCVVKRREQSHASSQPTSRTVRVLRSHGEQVAWVEDMEKAEGEQGRLTIYLLPERELKRHGLKSLQPSPQIWFTSKCLTQMSPCQASFELSDGNASLRFDRTVDREDSIVHQFRTYRDKSSALEIEEWFDLEKGGLIAECRYEDPNAGEGLYRHTTLSWQKASDGRWYPATVHEVSHKGSWSGDPRYTASLEILSSEPLIRQRFTSSPSLTTFGSLPQNVQIVTLGPDGKDRFQDRSAAKPEYIEGRLQQQARRLRGNGMLKEDPGK